MIEMDRKEYEKMVGIWSITRMPKLEMIVQIDHVSFTWVKGPITKVPYKIFDELAPIEIVNLIEQQVEKQHGINCKVYRSDFRGYLANPFSSQR